MIASNLLKKRSIAKKQNKPRIRLSLFVCFVLFCFVWADVGMGDGRGQVARAEPILSKNQGFEADLKKRKIERAVESRVRESRRAIREVWFATFFFF